MKEVNREMIIHQILQMKHIAQLLEILSNKTNLSIFLTINLKLCQNIFLINTVIIRIIITIYKTSNKSISTQKYKKSKMHLLILKFMKFNKAA